MSPEELLRRVGVALRTQVAPATVGAMPRSQAYKASTVLDKLSRQLRLAPEHQAADERDRARLLDDIRQLPAAVEFPRVRAAVAELAVGEYRAALAGLVDALYSSAEELGAELFERAIARVRVALRAEISRRMEFAA